MLKQKLLVSVANYASLCPEAKTMLEGNGYELILNPYGRPMTFDEKKGIVGDIVGAIVGIDAWGEELMRLAGKLKIIARFGVGVDNIDLKAAGRLGILVTNAKDQNANAVAEFALTLILCLLRQVPMYCQTSRDGKWVRKLTSDLAGKTVGLIGFGAIPQLLAKKLGSMDVNVIAYDKYPNQQVAAALNVSMMQLEEVLKQADIISCHLPALADTVNFFDSEKFQLMKDGAYFVNTARGSIVDEEALYEALNSKLAGAACDVHAEEPFPNRAGKLFSCPNYIGTPHTAADTIESFNAISRATAKTVLDALSGKETFINLATRP